MADKTFITVDKNLDKACYNRRTLTETKGKGRSKI